MNRMTISLLIISLLLGNISLGCECVNDLLVNRINQSDFIAKVKVLKVSAPTKDGAYQSAEIKVQELYKGDKINSININADLQSSCAMIVEEHTTWLVFAHYGKSGQLEFGACSGSVHLDESIDKEKYPNLKEILNKNFELKLKVLEYFKKNKITKPNEYNFILNSNNLGENFKGYSVKGDRFAVYQITVEKDLSISNVKAIKEFDNRELSKKLGQSIREVEKVKSNLATQINEPTQMFFVFYYYPSESTYQSFISRLDL